MSTLVNIGIVVAIISALAVVITIVIIKYREEKKQLDNPICLNFLAGQTEGRAIGVEQNTVIGKNGRFVKTFAPKDVNNLELIELPNVDAVVDKHKVITLPKGTWSKDKNINIYLPSSPEKFPDPIKHTEFGKMLMFWTAIKTSDNSLIDSLSEGMKRQSAHVINMGGAEVSVEQMTQIKELFQDALDAVKESKKDKVSSYTPPPYGTHTPGA